MPVQFLNSDLASLILIEIVMTVINSSECGDNILSVGRRRSHPLSTFPYELPPHCPQLVSMKAERSCTLPTFTPSFDR
jgi:hypothetical protein